jgi:c-di-GMP-binding flagellar brake protein YcgR
MFFLPDYDLKPGERLEVLREEKRGVSDVQALTAGGRLVISEPVHGEGRLPVNEGDLLRLFYCRPFGLLSCTVTAERIYQEDGVPLIEAEIRSQIRRQQRREFVRFETALPVSVIPLAEITESEDDHSDALLIADRKLAGPMWEDMTVKGFTWDISGGGLRFTVGQKLSPGTLAACTVDLGDGNPVDAGIRVIRCEDDMEDRRRFIISAKFIGIDDSQRGKIIRYIFDEQSRRKRK